MNRRCAIFAAALAALLGSGVAAPLFAASCCGGANNTDQFALSKWRHAMAGVSPQFSRAWAVRDGDRNRVSGTWRSDAVRLVAGGAYRVAPDWQVAAAVPGIFNSVAAGRAGAIGGGVGDLGAQVRYELLDEDTCFARPVTEMAWNEVKPSVHFFLRGTLPTGRPTSRATDALGASITGRGLWSAEAGVDVTKVWGRLGNGLSLAAGGQTPDRSAIDGVRALRWEAGAGVLYFPAYQRSLGLFVSHRQERGELLRVESTQLSLTGTLADVGAWWLRATVSAAGWLGGRNTPVAADGFVTVARYLE